MAITRAAPQILWGTNYENVLDFPIFDNVVTGRRPRDGSVQGRTSGVQVSWVEGWDYWMKGDARWIPDQDLTTPFVATGWSGPTGWQAFLDWARTWPNTFRFVPDRTAPDFYVDGCYLTVPFEEENGSPETDGTRSVSITVQTPTVDFSQALRGIMFEYAPGMSLTDPVAATFSRATAATRRGLPGSLLTGVGATDASGVLRDRHYDGTRRTTLLEGVRTQLVTNPETFSAWTVEGTPILTSGQSDPFGGTAAYLIDDNDGAANEDIYSTVSFTADGTKCISIFCKAGTATSSWFRLRDSTAGVDRHLVNITWTAGVPSLSTVGGSGTLFAVENWGGGWYRVAIGVNSVVAANSNAYQFGPAGFSSALTGTAYFFGANAWNCTYPTSYQGPSLTTKNGDNLAYPLTGLRPQAMAIYLACMERGLRLGIGTGAGNTVALELSAGNDPRITIEGGGGANYSVAFFPLTGSQTSSTRAVGAEGDFVELLALFRADGSVQLIRALNGDADSVGTQSGVTTFPATWGSSPQVYLGSRTGGSNSGIIPLAACKIMPLTFGGVTRDTLAKVRLA